jgi:hypothetical protein
VSVIDAVGGVPGTTALSARASRGACRPGRVTRCALGTIPPGGSATARIRVQTRRAGFVRNAAAVVAGAPLASARDGSARAGARLTRATPGRRGKVPVTG